VLASFGYSTLKLVGESFVAFEQIEVRLARVAMAQGRTSIW
jgi:hypothetical protein